MTASGPYSDAEQREWEQILEYPSYHNALMKSVTIGSCVETDSCSVGISDTALTRYDLTGISKNYLELIWQSASMETTWQQVFS